MDRRKRLTGHQFSPYLGIYNIGNKLAGGVDGLHHRFLEEAMGMGS